MTAGTDALIESDELGIVSCGALGARRERRAVGCVKGSGDLLGWEGWGSLDDGGWAVKKCVCYMWLCFLNIICLYAVRL